MTTSGSSRSGFVFKKHWWMILVVVIVGFGVVVGGVILVVNWGKNRMVLANQSRPTATVPVVIPTVTQTATPTEISTATVTATPVAFTLKGKDFPKGSGMFHSNLWKKGEPDDSDLYVLVYDTQWYHQPLLPKATDRVAHEVALVLIPGVYEFIGPECQVWWNWDGKSPADQGKLLIDRQNVLDLVIPETTGKGEAWVFVECRASQAGGFSFRYVGPLPSCTTATATPTNTKTATVTPSRTATQTQTQVPTQK